MSTHMSHEDILREELPWLVEYVREDEDGQPFNHGYVGGDVKVGKQTIFDRYKHVWSVVKALVNHSERYARLHMASAYNQTTPQRREYMNLRLATMSEWLSFRKHKLALLAKEKFGLKANAPHWLLADRYEEEGMEKEAEILRRKAPK